MGKAVERIAFLESVGKDIMEKFQPLPGVDNKVTTYCNLAVHYAFCAFGYYGFKNMNANAIVEWAAESPDFAKVDGETAAKIAADGRPVLAAKTAKVHGHVALVAPRPLVESGKWKKKVPMVFNVGRTNALMGANYAFNEEPEYYALV